MEQSGVAIQEMTISAGLACSVDDSAGEYVDVMVVLGVFFFLIFKCRQLKMLHTANVATVVNMSNAGAVSGSNYVSAFEKGAKSLAATVHHKQEQRKRNI